mgnify:CR=1 FL=1
MKLKGLYIILPIIAITLLNIFLGNVISGFLSVAIIAALVYYVFQINIENIIYHKLEASPSDEVKAKAAMVIKKYKMILSFLLMTVVFGSSIFCIYKTTNPTSDKPWFLNNDYHGISNNGITFNKSLSFYLANEDSLTTRGSVTISSSSSQNASLKFSNFFQPVFAQTQDEKVFTPINNIFPKLFKHNFKISNGLNTIDVALAESSKSFFDFGGSNKITYKISIASTDPALAEETNIAMPYADQIVIEDKALKEGKSLYNLFLNTPKFETGKNESYQVLEHILRQLGDSYLLVNTDGEQKSYSIFPSANFINNGYKMFAEQQAVAAQLSNTYTLAFDKKMYIGFHNIAEKAYITQVNNSDYALGSAGTSNTFIFDYPPVYLLSSPAEQQQVGNKNLRFIANNNDELLNSELREGFFFKNYGLNSNYSVKGNIDYVSQQPNVPLLAGIADNNKASTYQKIANNKFNLQSSEPGVNYLFTIRDFSENGFHFNKLVLFSCLMYLAFIAVLIFFPGKNLVRLEPVIFVVIYALLILRFILYWRLATFPPLENISKYELENTILNFDYKWGIQLPLPLTLIWLFLFLVSLSIYRLYMGKGKDMHFSPAEKWNLKTNARINKGYAVFIIACAVLFFINAKVLHMEILTRVSSIIIPIIGYCYFTMLGNKYFTFNQEWVLPKESKFYVKAKAYFHYFIHNPAFQITAMTIAFFLVTDRGFAILFTLFVLLKNVFLNFLKKPFNSEKTSLKKMLINPNNYWVYGVLALVVYLVILSFKSLFYYLLTYKLIVFGLLLLVPTLVLWFFYKKLNKVAKILAAIVVLYAVLIAVPATRQLIETKATSAIKHVQYRASIIHQPISELLSQNAFSSFQTQKIIETAENQWFINSYINKPYDNNSVINLRPYSKVGVNYNTQTRDVVIARFVIGELGNFTMYLILVLTLLPLILYLISYRLTDDKYYRLNYRSYAGLLPLLLLFTISLFVWLTATNRFVFFGQDFPFLSLTSKLSVVMPLILFGITLTQKPETYRSHQLNLKNNFARYAFFTLLVAGFAITTIRSNELSSNNFSIIVEKTKQNINQDLNAVLYEIQDSLDAKNKKYTYTSLINTLKDDKRFLALLEDSARDNYTKSIFKQLVEKPSNAFRIDNPLYIVYDKDKYSALYNEHLYLQLPAIENKKVWNGSITENLNLSLPQVNVSYNNTNIVSYLPFFKNDVAANLQLAIMPAHWFVGRKENVGILNVQNATANKAEIFIYKKSDNNIVQNATAFANTCNNEDIASVNTKGSKFIISYSNTGNAFATNKWVNGSYKILYPQKERNFWMYHFASAIRDAYKADSLLQDNVAISLDYNLQNKIQRAIDQTYSVNRKNNRFKFSVIAADGNGNVRMMNDFVSNKIQLDPNDANAINRLQQKHFFFSNIRNERDQWGHSNFMSMHLGPGSSIKPLISAVIASQANAGWSQLFLMAPNQAEYNNYGGLKLKKPWVNDDHYRAGKLSMDKYIEVSSNFYHSAMMFLGSYPKSAFVKNNTISLKNVLSGGAGNNNSYPVFEFAGSIYYLPNHNNKKGNWPATDFGVGAKKGYFGNENSILANGLEVNTNLRTKDKDKNDKSPGSYARINIVDSSTYYKLAQNKGSNFLWSFPEQSVFLQSQRSFEETTQNFNLGLKTATLGGYPYQISPFKLLEMYLSLFTQNRNLSLQIIPNRKNIMPWQIDSSWHNRGEYNQFLASNIFKGMNDVIYGGSGTAHALGRLTGAHPGYFFYAKTGTINEQGSGAKNSRRLIVAISNKDLKQAANIGQIDTKIYSLYFAVDNNRDFDWALINTIINEAMASQSFENYYK